MSVEVVFERDPTTVLQLIANAGINLEGNYIDTENDLYRIAFLQEDLYGVLDILRMLGQTYKVSLVKKFPFAVGTPGQLAKVWQVPGVVATYNLETGVIAGVFNDIYDN